MNICPHCGHMARTLAQITHSDGRIERLCPSCLGARKIPLLFQGEMMTCVVCGARERSDRALETQWRAIQMDARVVYACPAEFPPDGSDATKFELAYKLIFAAALGADAAKVRELRLLRKEAWG